MSLDTSHRFAFPTVLVIYESVLQSLPGKQLASYDNVCLHIAKSPIWVNGCVCVSGSLFLYGNESAKKTYESPQRCKHLNLNGEFFVKQAIHKATDSASKLLAQLSAILFFLTCAQAYF